ncbi:MAG: hypothetical protein JSU87_14070 [Gemmatimonadota bacterium]|nr:MAG: hypothetical protein JSU87_14070 [Gemmatimonadota bacterium]
MFNPVASRIAGAGVALAIPLLIAALTGCASKAAVGPAERPLVVFPLPPDTPRVQFLTAFGTSEDVEAPRSPSFWERLLGEKEEKKPVAAIIKPYGVTILNGRIYVCDTVLGGINVLDVRLGRFEQWKPTGLGKLVTPVNCHGDPLSGKLYVADTGREQVIVFDTTGAYVTSLGERKGSRPVDVFVHEDRIWVAYFGLREVRSYAIEDHRLLSTLPNRDAPVEEQIRGPTNIWVADDQVYVSDFGASQVKIYTTAGEFVRAVGSYGDALGQFARPKGIAVDRDANLFVVDAAFQNVQIFNNEGALLMFFGGPYEGPGTMWLPAKITVDYDNLDLFQSYVDRNFELQFLILVTNQYGPDKVSVYGFVKARQSDDVPG